MSNGTAVSTDPLGIAPRDVTASELAKLAFVRTVFLPLARKRNLVAPEALDALTEFAWDLGTLVDVRSVVSTGVAARSSSATPVATSSVRAPVPTQARAGRPPTTTPSSRPYVVDTPASTYEPAPAYPSQERPVVVAPPRDPSRFARWWARSKDAVGSDLAAHGLAYLGVLLLFVGVFGLVAFAFGDVAPTARPIAEIGIAIAPFAAAAMLLRRGAEIVGRALELAGGLLLPIMVITSFLDGVEVPPDLTGVPLNVALTVVAAVIALGYAWWTSRHPSTSLRFLVAPVAWLSVAMATMGLGREIPSGKGVATATAYQVAAISVAMVVSFAWSRLRPAGLLSAPTLACGIPSIVVLGPLAMLTWISGGWPELPIAITGLAGLLVLELLSVRLAQAVVLFGQPLWWGLVSLALIPGLGVAPAAVCSAAGFVALVEVDGATPRAQLPVIVSSVGLLSACVTVWAEPWWAFALMLALTVWAGARRLRPFALPGAEPVLDLAAGLFPVAAVAALAVASRNLSLGLLVGSALVLLATLPASWPERVRLRRDEADPFWVLWWSSALAAVSTSVGLVLLSAWPADASAQWMVAAAAGVLAVASAAGPIPAIVRPWTLLALASASWLCVTVAAGVPRAVAGVVIAFTALVVVVCAHAWPARLGRWMHAGSLGLAGHTLAVAAMVVVGAALGWAAAVAIICTTLGWAVTAAYDDRSPVVRTLQFVDEHAVRYVPPVLAGIGLPISSYVALDAAGVPVLGSPWANAVLVATGLVYAAAVRLPLGRYVVATLVWLACAAALCAVPLAGSRDALMVSLAGVIAAAGILPRAARPTPMTWVAWAAVAPFSFVVIASMVPPFADLPTMTALAWTLLAVGAVMLGAAAAIDLRGRSWRPTWWPARPALIPVAVIGVAELAVGLALATSVVPASTAGWMTVWAALVLAATASLTRAWSLVGVAAVLGWLAAWELHGDYLGSAPWVGVLATVGLWGAAEIAHRAEGDPRWWVRGDLGLIGAAHVTAATALSIVSMDVVRAGTPDDSFGRTFLAIGFIAIAFAARIRRRSVAALVYVLGGEGLVFVGAWALGDDWLSLALITMGGVALVACTALDLRGRSWTPVYRPVHPELDGAGLLGIVELLVGVGFAVALLPPSAAGALTALAAMVLLTTAVLSRASVLLAAAGALAWLSWWEFRGDDLAAAPWVSIVVTMALLGAAELGYRVMPERRWWARADLPMVAVAHLTAVTALVTATVASQPTGSGDVFSRTFVAVGLIAILSAARARQAIVPATAYAVGGEVLVLIGAGAAGSGWLALALAVLSVACSVIATRTAGVVRWILLVSGSASALAAWTAATAWLGWSMRDAVDATVMLGGVISVFMAVLLRWTRVDRAALIVRGGLAALTATVAPFVPLVLDRSTDLASVLSLWTSGALALVTVATAFVAAPLSVTLARYVAVGYLLATLVEAFVATGAAATVQLIVLGTSTLLCAVAVLVPFVREKLAVWLKPVMLLGSMTAVAGIVVSLAGQPDSGLLPTALLLAAVQLAAIGAALPSVPWQVCAPVVACAAWILYAAEALDGNPQWFTVPIGLTMLVVVGLIRHARRVRGLDAAAPDVVLLELTGIGFLVASSFVQAFTMTLAYTAAAAAVGVGVAGWGLVSQVRRRVLAGAVIVLAAFAVLIGVPVAQVMPAWTGAWLWVVIACVGLVAIVGATVLEEGRDFVRRGVATFSHMTEGWE